MTKVTLSETHSDTFDAIPVPPEDRIDDESPSVEQEQPARTFEDLSLSETLAHFFRHPVRTWIALAETLRRPGGEAAAEAPPEILVVEEEPAPAAVPINWRALAPLTGMSAALLIALIGSVILTSSRGVDSDRNLPFAGSMLIVGAVVMAVVALRTLEMPHLPPLVAAGEAIARPAQEVMAKFSLRALLVGVALLWTLGAWVFNVNNEFTTAGVFCWAMSIFTWTAALLDRDIALDRWIARWSERVNGFLRRPVISFRFSWTVLVLVVIMLVGGWFRFTGLGIYPPDMTSDHVEKALDALRVYDGARPIFFPNNGGREGFQMYYLALIKSITGIPIGLEFLQIGSGLEGMLMILLAWWMGRTIIGEEDRELGNLTGLVMAAMIAISFWHVALSRLGLRIVTTTIVAAVVFVFLVRALRFNRRSDYLITGLALGVGMYCYQAVRMLPLVVIVGVVLALILRARTRHDLGRYVVNLAALIIVSVAVFVPLGHYMVQYPAVFWERAEGRLLGEDGLRDPSLAWQNFQANLPGLTDNLKRSLLMFNFRGDMAWFSGAPDGTPELDFFAGALFIVGLGFLVARMIRRRDPTDWLLPVSVVIMLFPSALSIAYTIEVPSLTRASGALPMVYLIAALPLAVMLRIVQERIPSRRARYSVYGIVVVALLLAAMTNADTYFVVAMGYYRNSTLPHRQMGTILRGFDDSVGAPGNAFLPSYAYWVDYRAVGIEAGDPHWANIIWREPDVYRNFLLLIQNNIGGPYEIHPDRQLLFFVHSDDKEFLDILARVFPQAQTMKVSAFKPERDFMMVIVPPVGCDWLSVNVGKVPLSCQNMTPGQESSNQ